MFTPPPLGPSIVSISGQLAVAASLLLIGFPVLGSILGRGAVSTPPQGQLEEGLEARETPVVALELEAPVEIATVLEMTRAQGQLVQDARSVTTPVRTGQPREVATLPVLMYHYIDEIRPGRPNAYRRDLTVTPTDFRSQLELLESSGARTVGLGELMSYLRGGETLPARAVVLTFDDGYEDNYLNAYPLLKRLGMTATFFVVANLVGEPGYMTWEQLREMQRNGMFIQSHSLDHVDLAIQPAAELQRQLTRSRGVLESNLGRPVRFLAYPSGAYNKQTIKAAQEAGYEAAVTTNYHLLQRRSAAFELNRVRVKGADTVDTLAAKIVPTFWKYPRGQFGR